MSDAEFSDATQRVEQAYTRMDNETVRKVYAAIANRQPWEMSRERGLVP